MTRPGHTGNVWLRRSREWGLQGDVQRVFNHVRIVRDLPPIADYDGDGLTDVDERATYATSPYAADTDADGMHDGDEVAAGMDPNDDESLFVLSCFAREGSDMVLEWQSTDSRSYAVWGSTNLLSNSWFLVEAGIAGTAPVNAYTTQVPVSASFYRVRTE